MLQIKCRNEKQVLWNVLMFSKWYLKYHTNSWKEFLVKSIRWMRYVRKRNVCWSCTLKVMNGIRNKISTVWKQRSSVLSNLWIKSKLVVLYFSYTISNLLQWCIDPIKSLWISAKSTSVFVYWPNLCIECVLNLWVHKHPWYWYSYYNSKYLAEGEIS